jgi:5-methylcytosine-specific restriction endonuclease McrA
MEDQKIIEACRSSLTMSEACSKVGLHFNTFKSKAIELGVYRPNRGGKGVPGKASTKFDLNEILDGKYPQYQTNKLKGRLFEENVKERKCEKCGIEEWNELPLAFELNHIDGNKFNHRLDNLEILCPNCHSQTSTFRGKNVKR